MQDPSDADGAGHSLPERIILGVRYIMLAFLAGLSLALLGFAIVFVVHVAELAPKLFSMDETDLILALLGLIDSTLIASLVVMVVISGYDNFVRQIAPTDQSPPWLGSLDAGGLKIKIATSIVAISSIELLEAFLNLDHYEPQRVMLAAGLQLTFVLSALGLAALERMTRH